MKLVISVIMLAIFSLIVAIPSISVNVKADDKSQTNSKDNDPCDYNGLNVCDKNRNGCDNNHFDCLTDLGGDNYCTTGMCPGDDNDNHNHKSSNHNDNNNHHKSSSSSNHKSSSSSSSGHTNTKTITKTKFIQECCYDSTKGFNVGIILGNPHNAPSNDYQVRGYSIWSKYPE